MAPSCQPSSMPTSPTSQPSSAPSLFVNVTNTIKVTFTASMTLGGVTEDIFEDESAVFALKDTIKDLSGMSNFEGVNRMTITVDGLSTVATRRNLQELVDRLNTLRRLQGGGVQVDYTVLIETLDSSLSSDILYNTFISSLNASVNNGNFTSVLKSSPVGKGKWATLTDTSRLKASEPTVELPASLYTAPPTPATIVIETGGSSDNSLLVILVVVLGTVLCAVLLIVIAECLRRFRTKRVYEYDVYGEDEENGEVYFDSKKKQGPPHRSPHKKRFEEMARTTSLSVYHSPASAPSSSSSSSQDQQAGAGSGLGSPTNRSLGFTDPPPTQPIQAPTTPFQSYSLPPIATNSHSPGSPLDRRSTPPSQSQRVTPSSIPTHGAHYEYPPIRSSQPQGKSRSPNFKLSTNNSANTNTSFASSAASHPSPKGRSPKGRFSSSSGYGYGDPLPSIQYGNDMDMHSVVSSVVMTNDPSDRDGHSITSRSEYPAGQQLDSEESDEDFIATVKPRFSPLSHALQGQQVHEEYSQVNEEQTIQLLQREFLNATGELNSPQNRTKSP